jgi:hypothetical protein
LQYQVEAVTLLLNQQLAKRSDQNLSNIQADKEEEAGARLADFDEVEAPEAVSSTSSSSKVSTTKTFLKALPIELKKPPPSI